MHSNLYFIVILCNSMSFTISINLKVVTFHISPSIIDLQCNDSEPVPQAFQCIPAFAVALLSGN